MYTQWLHIYTIELWSNVIIAWNKNHFYICIQIFEKKSGCVPLALLSTNCIACFFNLVVHVIGVCMFL